MAQVKAVRSIPALAAMPLAAASQIAAAVVRPVRRDGDPFAPFCDSWKISLPRKATVVAAEPTARPRPSSATEFETAIEKKICVPRATREQTRVPRKLRLRRRSHPMMPPHSSAVAPRNKACSSKRVADTSGEGDLLLCQVR